MELERTKENWKAAEKGNREKFDAKIKEYNKMERKLENSEAKVDELQSKLDKINVLNQLAKTCSIKTALFVKQKKASSEAKVMVPETKDKNEKENDKSIKTDLTKIHEECERQINNLTAELKNEKIKVETAEMKLKEFNDKNQSHIRYANVEEFRDIVEVPVRKRQRTLNNQLPQQQHSSSAPSTSVPTPMTSQQQQQPNYGYENFYYPQYYPQLSYPSHHLFQQFPPQNVYYPPQQQQLHQINNNINLGQPRPIFPGMNFCKSSTPRPPY
uniref:FRIGIDA-like protein n=1 Tax=Panagrolaimus superbus TaxID=310955 RepID=A0A914YZD9_9BILA